MNPITIDNNDANKYVQQIINSNIRIDLDIMIYSSKIIFLNDIYMIIYDYKYLIKI